MSLRFIRILSLVLLCAALVYAPEIFSAVSAPYKQERPERTLLRVALCTQDAEASKAFYAALNDFRKTAQGVHLRVLRVDEAQLAALADPKPDAYVISQNTAFDAGILLPFNTSDDAQSAPQRLYPFKAGQEQSLLCGVRADAAAQDAAVAFVSYLYAYGPDASEPGD